jgi:hypothetical protein
MTMKTKDREGGAPGVLDRRAGSPLREVRAGNGARGSMI